MPYWRLFYHLVWATKDRVPVIDDTRAPIIERSIRTTCRETDIRLHAVGIMPDHVHIAASIPPRIAISTVVGRLKGAATHAVNDADRGSAQPPFSWQAEYGVLSFGEKALLDVVAYVRNQPAHHAANRLWATLETATDRPQPASAGLSV